MDWYFRSAAAFSLLSGWNADWEHQSIFMFRENDCSSFTEFSPREHAAPGKRCGVFSMHILASDRMDQSTIERR